MSKRSTSEAFTVAVALHIVAVAILLVSGFLAEWMEEDPPVIMQLVDLSPDLPVSRDSSEGPTTSEPLPDEPEPTLTELEALEIPEFEDLAPPPEIPPRPEPAPKPEPPRTEPPPPRKISFSEHVAEYGAPKVTPPRKTERKPPPTPNITTHVREELYEGLSRPKLQHSASLSVAQTSALDAYVAGIQQRLQAVFRPVGPPGLKATVSFTVAPNGVFARYRILVSSGDPAFDAAALAAFKRVARFRPTPEAKIYEWEIDFRSKL